VSAARERRGEGGAVAPPAPPATPRHEPHGIDQACLAHLLGYQLSLADIPAKRVFFRAIGEPLALRPVEFTILILAAFNPGATQKQLAQALALSAPNMTILLDRLAERGLLERVRSATDRRVQNIHLTPAGRKLARRAHETSLTMEQELLRHLSDGERVLLLELLHKVSRHRRV
jgi:DNA-binding MarR family transcriptional regulator